MSPRDEQNIGVTIHKTVYAVHRSLTVNLKLSVYNVTNKILNKLIQ